MSNGEKKGMGGCAKAAIGCLVVVVILSIATAVGVYFLAKNARSWGSSLVAGQLTQAIEQSDLPDDQKDRIVARVDQLQTDFADGRITMEQIGRVGEAIGQSPVLSAATAMYIDAAVVQPSQLSAEEKAAARQTVQRFAQGMIDKSISEPDARAALAPILQNPASTNWNFKRNPTAEQLGEALENAGAAADAAGVAQQPEEIDFAGEIESAIDAALRPGP